MTIRAYLIDPVRAVVSAIELPDGDRLDAIYAAIGNGCDIVESVDLGAGHFAFIDEEGMLKPADALWSGRGATNNPIAGRAVVLRAGPDGESLAPIMPMSVLARLIVAFQPKIYTELVSVEPVQFLGTTLITAGALGSFRVALTKANFTVEA